MINVQGLTHYYGERRAIEGLSFQIANNEIVGFLGLNGAGKSTTLKILAGLVVPSAGSVSIDGVDIISADTTFRSRIGYLPEDPPLYKEMTVTGFVRFCGQLKGMATSAVDARMAEVLQTTQLTAVKDRVIGELSHGYKKRVGIAQAIIHAPQLVILDEPISGLDPRQIVEMRKVIRALAQSCTVLISSHILAEISETCDRIMVLANGRIAAQGTEAELTTSAEAAGARLTLLVRATEAQLAAALLKVEGVIRHSVVVDGDCLRVHVALQRDNREVLVAALVAGGVGIRRLVEDESELEQVFLRLTKEAVA